jgi:hypothetical protein
LGGNKNADNCLFSGNYLRSSARRLQARAGIFRRNLGARDFGSILQKSGPMVEPLKDPAYFARVFTEDGALTWPDGYDWDPIASHDEMKAAGLLRQSYVAE